LAHTEVNVVVPRYTTLGIMIWELFAGHSLFVVVVRRCRRCCCRRRRRRRRKTIEAISSLSSSSSSLLLSPSSSAAPLWPGLLLSSRSGLWLERYREGMDIVRRYSRLAARARHSTRLSHHWSVERVTRRACFAKLDTSGLPALGEHKCFETKTAAQMIAD